MGIHVIFRPEITLLVTENFLYVRCCNDPTCDKTEGLGQKTGRAEARMAAGCYSMSLDKRKRLHYVAAEGLKTKIWNN